MKKKDATGQLPPIFFILGIPRSGTTLLTKLLDNHSQIGVCPESNFMLNIIRYQAQQSFKTGWHYRQFMEGISNWLIKFNDPAYQLVQQQLKLDPAYRGSSRHLLQQMITSYLEKKGKIIFGEKTPENTYYLEQLQQFCPSAKLVIVMRNPLDIICSLGNSLAKVYQQDQPYSSELLLKSAVFVKRGLRAILSGNNNNKENRYIIEYEQLVSHPENELRSLCEFLKVPYESRMIHFEPDNYFISKDQRAIDLHKGLSRPINDRSVNQYQQLLSTQQINLLQQFLKPELALLPYTFKTQSIQLSLKQQISLRKYQFFFQLKSYLWKEQWIRLKIKLKYFLNR